MDDTAYVPFPTGILPPVLAQFIAEIADAMVCDESYISLPLLAAVASAIGNTRRIALKRSWSEPAVLWCAVVGDSGTVKSAPIEAATLPVWRRQAALLKAHAAALAEHAAERHPYRPRSVRTRLHVDGSVVDQ